MLPVVRSAKQNKKTLVPFQLDFTKQWVMSRWLQPSFMYRAYLPVSLSLVSAGGGPGPHKPVIPPPVLASSQPVVGTPQPPPPINTTPPYQVMGKQPYSVKLAGD